ncbi:MAG: DNA gyrase subunit A, partial [Gammaproteobacteria bacterium]|nr:DNA gyrase subunit A [Gammaproteobacteria bacterium]
PLVDGQGNFGSVDGDSPAAMRYTEVRMSKIAHELLKDIDKETVDFALNYDESEQEPTLLPAAFPNLLVNGSSGIAVGIATNIPPHNLVEVINGCLAVMDRPDISAIDLLAIIPGPDFPTAGIINGARGIAEAYATGKGRIYVRARANIERDENSGKEKIIVTELPYQVNKARLLEKIAELVKEKRLEGISELRDESDKDGLRMVIEIKKSEAADVILNNLYQHTQMQNVFGINMVALLDGQPKLLGLRTMLEAFIRHRREIVTRRTIFDLRKARDRAHILEGLAVALSNIDPIIALIKASPTPTEAKVALVSKVWEPGVVNQMLERAGAQLSKPEDLPPDVGLLEGGYRLSETQAQAILEMRLHRLTGLEQDKIIKEYKEILDLIEYLLSILSDPEKLKQVIRDELVAIRDEYGDARRTEIVSHHEDLRVEDLIEEEQMVVTLSHLGYAKAQPLDAYSAQKRGGRGKTAATVRDDDFIDKLFIANTHDTILCFSSRGKVYWLKVYEIPQAGRTARGKPFANLLPLEPDERINAILPIPEFDNSHFVVMATSGGTVKKTSLEDFSRPRASGIIAIDLRDDQLVGVDITDGTQDIMLFTSAGKAIRFNEDQVRAMGRTAAGVRGVKLAEDQKVISLMIVEDGMVLTATENGFGKRTPIEDYPAHGRGGQGVISIQTTERNGAVVAAVLVKDGEEVMLISDGGTLVRTKCDEISVVGRNTQGVRLINLGEGEKLVGMEAICDLEEDEGED